MRVDTKRMSSSVRWLAPGIVAALVTLGGFAPERLRVRIEAVEEDRDSRGGPLWLHTLSIRHADGTWASFCRPGARRTPGGLPRSRTRDSARTVAEAEPGVFELTCTGRAQAKCVRFGYRPWEPGPDGRPMRVLYNACVRMVRADYGGDGHSTTRDGMLIDIYDAWKIQTPDLREKLRSGLEPGGRGVRAPRPGQGERVAGGVASGPAPGVTPEEMPRSYAAGRSVLEKSSPTDRSGRPATRATA